MRNAFIDTLICEAEKNDKIWLLNADLGFSVLEEFAQRFPDRYLNVGVAEQNMVGIAAGLAMSGYKIFIYSIGNFPTFRCIEQLRNDVCYHNADVKVVSVGGGFAYGSQGYTHHAIEDIAAMRTLPGMTVFAPGDPVETKAAVEYFNQESGPGYLRLGRAGEPLIHTNTQDIYLNKGLVPVSSGSTDLLLLSTGGILTEALAAQKILAEAAIDASVMSLPMLKPLQTTEILKTLNQYQHICTIEEHSEIGGLKDTLASILLTGGCNAKFTSFAVGDGMTQGVIGSQQYMRKHCRIDAEHIASELIRQYQNK